MAIEWNIFDAAPVGRMDIVRAAREISDRLLGSKVFDFSVPLAGESSQADPGSFASQIYVTGDSFSALVDLESGPEIDDDGSFVEGGLCFGTVTARRTMASVALGFSVALGWLEISDGMLMGSGLRGNLSADMVHVFVAEYGEYGRIDGRTAVEVLAKKIMGEDTVVPFS